MSEKFRVTFDCGDGDSTTRTSDHLSDAIFNTMAASCDLGAWSPFDFLAHAVAVGASYSDAFTFKDTPEAKQALDEFVQAARNLCDAIGWKFEDL